MFRRLLFAVLPLAACAAPVPASHRPAALLPEARPPATATVAQVDSYHGTPVVDPYRWLEDDRSPQTAAWVAAQNQVTQGVLDELPQRAALHSRLTELWNVPRVNGVKRIGAGYAWSRNDGLQPQDVVLVGERPADGGRVLFDPMAWSADGTVALADAVFSDDGRLAAYALSDGGSDWRTLRVRDVATGRDTGDELRWVKFSRPSWHPDGRGFWYSRYPQPEPGQELSAANRDMTVHFHELSQPQSRDRLVFSDPEHPEWNFAVQASDDGRWLVRTTWRGSINRRLIHVRPLEAPDEAPWRPIDDTWELDISWLGNDGDVHYVETGWEAPRGRVMAVDLARPERAAWRELVPEQADALESSALFGDTLVLTYLRDAQHVVVLRGLQPGGAARELPLPGPGSVSGFSGRRDDPETFFEYTSFSEPASVWRLLLPEGRAERLWRPELRFDPEDFVTDQAWFASQDGTRVPLFLVHRRDVGPDGDRPVFLYGYGGFNIALKPAFRADMIPLLERGGVWAQPSLRGGSEYGEDWHAAGMLDRKQNVFDDFVGAAEWLVEAGWTRPGRIAIHGRSNGGLLVGAALTQRPDLWGCALPAVGVLDMLRYHRFTIGWSWVPEYGSADDAQAFRWLSAYSPLQAAQAGEAPVLIRVETRAGHGAGKPVEFRIAEAADMWAFALAALGES